MTWLQLRKGMDPDDPGLAKEVEGEGLGTVWAGDPCAPLGRKPCVIPFRIFRNIWIL